MLVVISIILKISSDIRESRPCFAYLKAIEGPRAVGVPTTTASLQHQYIHMKVKTIAFVKFSWNCCNGSCLQTGDTYSRAAGLNIGYLCILGFTSNISLWNFMMSPSPLWLWQWKRDLYFFDVIIIKCRTVKKWSNVKPSWTIFDQIYNWREILK